MAKPPFDLYVRATDLSLTEDVPEAPYGRVEGIALVYDVEDDHGTMFARGCLDRTRTEKVTLGKVKLYWDHGDAPANGFYDSDLHIGTVRSLTDIQLPDGRHAAYMVADFRKSPKAAQVRDEIKDLLDKGGSTGLSVGFRTRRSIGKPGIERGTRFLEIELKEISITSMQSVPDSEVLAVRSSPDRLRAALAVIIATLGPDEVRATLEQHTQDPQDEGDAPATDSDAGDGSPPSPDSDAAATDSRSTAPLEEPETVTMEQRTAAYRQSFAEV
jgi:HK97 family phage prohead protease